MCFVISKTTWPVHQMYQLSKLFMIKYQKENLTFKCTLWTVHHLVVLENNFQIASHCQRIFCIARDKKGKTSFYDQFRFKNDRKFFLFAQYLDKVFSFSFLWISCTLFAHKSNKFKFFAVPSRTIANYCLRLIFLCYVTPLLVSVCR